ncbi:hypothetical protein PHISCL_10744 [Aspergillus sclerotialis]|uniref:Uncharacterized protein n=1 Tax=Aspergillus sclerotialis TaxID=2070753 RepID=A0A3A2Z1J2_9EURO|nr:hypothetical protein PHISCL_10744 [Aspergillus sclerotialis]
MGFPAESRRVTDPFGVVLRELATDAGGWKEEPSIESLPDDMVDDGVRVMEPNSFVADLTEAEEDMLPVGVPE